MAVLEGQTRTLPVYFLDISQNKCRQKKENNYKIGNRQDDASSNRCDRETKQRKRVFPTYIGLFCVH